MYRRLAEQGYVAAHVGRGTFVRAHPRVEGGADDDDWQLGALPARPGSYSEQMLAESLGIGRDAIPLATGFPADALLPAPEFAELAASIAADGDAGLQYLPVEGLPELRARLAELGTPTGWARDAEEIVVTTGARQGLDLVARAVLGPGDVAVIESPAFAGALTSLQATGARVLPVAVDDEGFDVAALERLLARHEIRLVVLQTACQNPTGLTLSDARRARLAALARERGFFILEDGVYATMAFEGSEATRLRALAPAHVIYVDSLSKTLGGGLRVGWIAARGPIRARLVRLKMDTDLHSAALPQHLAAAWLAGGRHGEHLRRVLPIYRQRRDVLLDALERHLDEEATWIVPGGRPARLGDPAPRDRRARALRRGAARRRGLPARRRHAGRAVGAHQPAAVVLLRRPGATRRGRPSLGARAALGAPAAGGRGDGAGVLTARAPGGVSRRRTARRGEIRSIIDAVNARRTLPGFRVRPKLCLWRAVWPARGAPVGPTSP